MRFLKSIQPLFTLTAAAILLAAAVAFPARAGTPGAQKWAYTATGPIASSPAIGADGTVYFASVDGNIYAVNPDGSPKWSLSVSTQTAANLDSSPAIGADGTIYVGGGYPSYGFYALDGQTGAVKWWFNCAYVAAGAAIGSDGAIYFGCSDYNLYALHPDGTLKWSYNVGSDIYDSPALGADGTVYFIPTDSEDNPMSLYALNGQTGAVKWTSSIQFEGYSSPVIAADGTIYVGGGQPNWGLYAIDPDGNEKWFFKTSLENTAAAIGADGTIYVGSADEKFYAINPDGTQKWSTATVGYAFSSAAIGAGQTVYVGTQENTNYIIYSFDGQTGAVNWTFAGPSGPTVGGSSPAIGPDGTVYVGGGYGNDLYAIYGDSGTNEGGLQSGSPWPMFLANDLHTAEAPGQLASSTTTLTSSKNPCAVGQSVTLTASVSGTAPSPTGTVTFSDGGAALSGGMVSLNSAGMATWTGSFSTVGSHPLSASYSGDSGHSSSVGTLNEMVKQASTTTSLHRSANPAQHGQTVTFTATVTGAYGGVPTGTVTFVDGGTALSNGTVSLTAGMASWSGSFSTVANHGITVTYSGDSNYLPSSVFFIETVTPLDTTTNVHRSANPVQHGQSVTFAATVIGSDGGTPTGTVTFADGGATLPAGTVTLVAGMASWTGSFTTVANHAITVSYSGDVNYLPSSEAFTEMVTLLDSTINVHRSANPTLTGQLVTFSATVSGSDGGVPTGMVMFADGGAPLANGTIALAAGVASWTGSFSVTGSHAITVSYSGDSNYLGSSTSFSESVLQATTITVASSVNPAVTNQTYSLTVTVSATAGGGVPTGSVQVLLFGVPFGPPVPLTAGVATSTYSGGSAFYLFTFIYSGDPNFAASTGSFTELVHRASTTVALQSSLNPVGTGQSVTLTATVTAEFGGSPSGSIVLMNGSAMLASITLVPNAAGSTATLSLSFATAGTRSITAVYVGDANYLGSTSTALSQTVN